MFGRRQRRVNDSASAVCTLVLSSGTSYQIQAEYNGDANFDMSGSSELTQNVNVASTTTTVATSAAKAITDQAITFTATVAPVSPGGGVPSDGTVTFDIDGTAVTACEGQTITAGMATCTVADLDVGGGPTYSVTGFYSGAPDYSPSDNSGSPLLQTIVPAATSTTITSNTNPSAFGQSVIFTATVAPIAPGGGVPTGTATVSADGSTLCTGSLVSGRLTCTVGSLTAGTHQLTASYAASTDYGASTSSTLTQGVNQSSTTTTVTSSDNPSSFGEIVTITATVAACLSWSGNAYRFGRLLQRDRSHLRECAAFGWCRNMFVQLRDRQLHNCGGIQGKRRIHSVDGADGPSGPEVGDNLDSRQCADRGHRPGRHVPGIGRGALARFDIARGYHWHGLSLRS